MMNGKQGSFRCKNGMKIVLHFVSIHYNFKMKHKKWAQNSTSLQFLNLTTKTIYHIPSKLNANLSIFIIFPCLSVFSLRNKLEKLSFQSFPDSFLKTEWIDVNCCFICLSIPWLQSNSLQHKEWKQMKSLC